MPWFSVRTISTSTVPVESDELWKIITDPRELAALTPLVRSIDASGNQWVWRLNGLEALGVSIEAVFTERMRFTDGRQIVFTHEPPGDKHERAGVEGIYDLTPANQDATDLRIDLTLAVELPLPRLAAPAVDRAIRSTMHATGHRFAHNLYERLGLDPSTATITHLPVP